MKKPKTLRGLFNKPERWTWGTFARNKDGEPSGIEHAVSFCLTGGVCFVYGAYSSATRRVMSKLEECLPKRFKKGLGNNLVRFNDARTRKFEQIRELVLKAKV